MAFNLKLSGSNDAAGQTASDTTIMDDAQPIATKKSASGPGFLGQYSVIKQLQILGGAFLLIVVIIIAFVYRDNRESAFNSTYIATAGEMRMLSQRLAKASSLALQGNTSAFKQLRDSHSQFVTNLERLTKGGELAGTTVPPSPDDVQPQLQALTKTWSATDKDAVQLLDMETNLVALSKDVASITNKNPEMLELSEQVAALKLQSGAGVREIAAANQMVMLTQRIAKNASSLLVGDEISPEIAFLLGKDTNTFRELLNALQKGNENLRISGTTDADTKRKLGDLETSFKEYQDAVGGILGSMQRLTLAKRAGSSIFRNSEGLLESTDNLANAYQQGGRLAYGVTFAVLMFLALATLAMMAKVYLDDSRRQAETANESRQATESINRQNQDAILRLMNELGDLADGDLTVTATVSEDITGAIADSINYTIEELRVLVRRINDAAGRVTTATGIAQQTSVELLEAAQRQSEEIQAAGLSVLAMASSMTKVSGDADQSAQVARQSLAAAGKGTQAVQDSIKGMTEIREQIQETSKRIKRLGESSQEIGEIVELISDITEQTLSLIHI